MIKVNTTTVYDNNNMGNCIKLSMHVFVHQRGRKCVNIPDSTFHYELLDSYVISQMKIYYV